MELQSERTLIPTILAPFSFVLSLLYYLSHPDLAGFFWSYHFNVVIHPLSLNHVIYSFGNWKA